MQDITNTSNDVQAAKNTNNDQPIKPLTSQADQNNGDGAEVINTEDVPMQ